jgi:Arylsulfotransferase (ASST)
VPRSGDTTTIRARVGILAGLLAALALLVGAPAAFAGVYAYPAPGGHVASPQTQIIFRGVSYGQLTSSSLSVTGSRSGSHSGKFQADSDGRGGSWLPASAFTAGETVTVKTSLPVVGAKGGSFRFTVAQPAGAIPFKRTVVARRTSGDTFRFQSMPSLQPTRITFMKDSKGVAPGDIFLAPQAGPVQYGPEIIDQNGYLVWSQPAPKNDEVTDFGVQTYQGKPVLTWWQGNVNAGTGRGQDVIYSSSYQQIGSVSAGNGLSADLHDFQITPQNTALITSYYPVWWSGSSVHGPRRMIVLDGVVQEIDIKTGLVLFQWDSLDHVPLSASYSHLPPKNTRNPYDYFHLNSVGLDHDGSLLISSRNTWAVFKVNHRSGAVIWTLGGKHSSFRMGRGASFAFQHDVRVRSGHDWYITMFDNGAGPPVVHPSRALKLFLDVRHKTAREVAQHTDSPPVQSYVEGNYQQLPDGNTFVGWGAGPYLSEFSRGGTLLLNGRFLDKNGSYRIFRYTWTGNPQQPPAVTAKHNGAHTDVYASWNGATNVSSWRVLGGTSSGSLGSAATAKRHGFETHITVNGAPAYVEVQALDSKGHVLASSAPTQSG